MTERRVMVRAATGQQIAVPDRPAVVTDDADVEVVWTLYIAQKVWDGLLVLAPEETPPAPVARRGKGKE